MVLPYSNQTLWNNNLLFDEPFSFLMTILYVKPFWFIQIFSQLGILTKSTICQCLDYVLLMALRGFEQKFRTVPISISWYVCWCFWNLLPYCLPTSLLYKYRWFLIASLEAYYIIVNIIYILSTWLQSCMIISLAIITPSPLAPAPSTFPFWYLIRNVYFSLQVILRKSLSKHR